MAIDDKILDFLATAYDSDPEIMPIERDALLQDLQAISPEISTDYINGLDLAVEMQLLLKDIFSSTKSPRITQHLVEGLDKTQFRRLQKIVLNLRVEESDSQMKHLVEATLGYGVYPLLESIPSAETLLQKMKSFKGTYADKVNEMALLAKDAQALARNFVLLNLNEEFDTLVFERLSRMPKEDLDRLLELASGPVVNNP